ncbi:hypothetical protein B484DRAFT_443229 [Ochromonadaceae sp. CCMP2298]|nr:hypothetical protein B484DRAFT_443229 [Ochromonadaceae sp. CCMP2298]
MEGSSKKTEREEEEVSEEVEKENQEAAAKKQKTEEACIVCMENQTPERALIEHQCTVCTKDSWKICEQCNTSILSRSCPVCRSDYAPVVMFAFVPELPLNRLIDSALTAEQRSLLLLKLGTLQNLIKKSNVAVWEPSGGGKMHFSLPQDFNSDSSVMTVSVAMAAERTEGEAFMFSNELWDEIEAVVESGARTDLLSSKAAEKWVLSCCVRDGHKIFSVVPPTEWSETLESHETTQALKKINDFIVAPMFARHSEDQADREQELS